MNWGFTGNGKSRKPWFGYLPGSVPAGASLMTPALMRRLIAMSPNIFWPIVWISVIAGLFLLKGYILGLPH